MEDDFVAKDERIKNIQQVVETQLNMMEFLEDKLDKTEEELFIMEDELNEVLILVENRTQNVSNESIQDSNKHVLLARMGSIREDMGKRKDSIKMQKEQSRRLLLNECSTTDRSRLSHLVTSSTTNRDDLDKSEGESMKALIASLEKENKDLRGQLSHIRATVTNDNDKNSCPRTHTPSQTEIDRDDEAVICTSEENCGEVAKDEEGKDLLIRELQNQLVAAKKEAYQLSSGSVVTKLKLEINSLKKEDALSKSHLKKKADSLKLLEKQMHKLKFELERREKRDKNLGTDQKLSSGDLQNHIEDLEEEIFHWKSANASLESEIEILKSIIPSGDEDIAEDDCSIGSLQSLNSVSQNDTVFASNSNSVSSINCIDEEPATPSKRAMQTVTNLWSKMRSGAEPANSSLAFPYATGSLNDD